MGQANGLKVKRQIQATANGFLSEMLECEQELIAANLTEKEIEMLADGGEEEICDLVSEKKLTKTNKFLAKAFDGEYTKHIYE